MKGGKEIDIIPRKLAQQIGYHDLCKEVGKGGSYPEGTTIVPTPFCFLRHTDSGDGMKPLKWELGFKIKPKAEPEMDIVLKMNPHTGKIIGITEMPTGYDGTSSKDIQIVTPEKTLEKEKTTTV